MTARLLRRTLPAVLAVAVLAVGGEARPPAAGQTDLDAFMRDVMARRDDNWTKLQQYVLDERETIDVRRPGSIPLWGERRGYTWYLRDGYFVRSPVTVNGVRVPENDRLKAEQDYLRRAQRRAERRARDEAERANDGADPQTQDIRTVDGLIKQAREPGFISSAYFMKFKFEGGKYALVGRESIDGHDVLRIEYYPARLFTGTDRRRSADPATEADRARDRAFQQLMNKNSLVTLWVEPATKQIVRYTFDNIGFDFLPAQWLVHVDDMKASMNMSQPFPDVWLPEHLEIRFTGTLAVGQFDMRYVLDYHDYRKADVTTRVGIREP